MSNGRVTKYKLYKNAQLCNLPYALYTFFKVAQFALRVFNAILRLSNLRFKKWSRKTQNAQRICLQSSI